MVGRRRGMVGRGRGVILIGESGPSIRFGLENPSPARCLRGPAAVNGVTDEDDKTDRERWPA